MLLGVHMYLLHLVHDKIEHINNYFSLTVGLI